MQFDNVTELLHMGGHGAYVWSCYLLGALVLGWNLFAARAQHRRFLAEELRRQRRADAEEASA